MVAPPTLTRLSTADAVAAYVASLTRAQVTGSLSATTVANYTRDLAEFVEHAGADTVLDDITADRLDEIMVAYASRPDGRYTNPAGRVRSIGATARFRQSVSRLFTHATRVGWVQVNPFPDMRVTLHGHRTRAESRTALGQTTATALLHTPAEPQDSSRGDQDLHARDAFILAVLLEVGPRVAELCSADRADLTKDDSGVLWFTIRHAKGGKPRRVPLSAGTADLLSAWDAARPTPKARTRTIDGETVQVDSVQDAEQALLLTWRGVRMRPRDVQNMVHRRMAHVPAQVRRQVTPHGLRHTAATLLLTSGAADVSTVRDLLGHASIATTSTYLDGSDAQMVAAVRAHPVTARPIR